MRRLSLAAALTLVLAAPAAARAATVGVYTFENGTTDAEFTAADGESNDLTVTAKGRRVTFHDAGAPVAPLDGCRAVDANTVACAVDFDVRVDLGDMDDRLRFAVTATGGEGFFAGADGGDGNDTLTGGNPSFQELLGGEGDDTLTGGPEHDIVEGGPGDDVVLGGAGNDELRGDGFGHPGRDVIAGGGGTDTVIYGGRKRPVTVDLRRAYPQGAQGENDTVTGVENVTGGRAKDLLIGDEHDNRLRGGGGADVFRSGLGDDVLWANPRAGNPRHRNWVGGQSLGCGAGDDEVLNVATHTVVPAVCEHVRLDRFSIRTALRPVGDSELRTAIVQREHFRGVPYCRGVVELSGPYPSSAAERPPVMGTGTAAAPLGKRSVVRIRLNEYGRALLAGDDPVRVLVSVGGDHRCAGSPPTPPRGFTLLLR
jgi:Ca2+-binding RTX toxin-like protein